MNIVEMIFSGISLAIDALTASICLGMNNNKKIIYSIYFGIFQMVMPIIGFVVGSLLYAYIKEFDHYISFILLTYLGVGMIKNNEEMNIDNIFLLAMATSIDALCFGSSYLFGYGSYNAYLTFSIIGLITFILCSIGNKLGNYIGNKYGKITSIIGGVFLILLGIKILLSHIMI